MRIAHVTATFPPYYSGTGMVCYHNALELARRGHDVTVFTAAHPPGQHEYPPEIKVVRLPPLFRIGNAPLLLGLLRLRGFDLIHLHMPFYFGAEFTARAARLGRIPLVITYHQDVILAGTLGNALANLHDRVLGAGCLRSAARVCFTTLDYGQASRMRWLFTERPERICALPNGVDIERFNPAINGESIRGQCHWNPETFVVLLVAGLDRAHYFKGVEVLLEALKIIANAEVCALIVGEGDLRAHYQSQAARLGLAERVSFSGHVPTEALPAYYAAADVAVLPSVTMGEAFGMVLIEAMACGKPVIASNLPGVRAVVQDGENGWLCLPGDAEDLKNKLQCLFENPDQRGVMGAKGRTQIEATYAWPRVIDRLVAVYASALSDRV